MAKLSSIIRALPSESSIHSLFQLKKRLRSQQQVAAAHRLSPPSSAKPIPVRREQRDQSEEKTSIGASDVPSRCVTRSSAAAAAPSKSAAASSAADGSKPAVESE